MNDLADLERRIMAALDQIERGLEALSVPPTPVAAPQAASSDAGAQTGMAEALDAERVANAQLTERVRAIRARQETLVAGLETRLADCLGQLDDRGLEVQRLKKSNIALGETVRVLREAAGAGLAEPHLLNKAMLAELDAMRAMRASDIAEMDEIIAELKPLIKESADA